MKSYVVSNTGALVLCIFLALASYGRMLSAQSNIPKPTNGDTVPSFNDVINLRVAGSPCISPDGAAIAYTVRSTDWDANRFDTEVWLARCGEKPLQLTRTKDGSSGKPRWSPDSQHIAFLADRGDKNQIQVINADGGEAWQLTEVEEGINSFRWSPDGGQIAYSALEPMGKDHKAREETYGEFAIEDQETRRTHLWLIDVLESSPEPRRLTEGSQFTVGDFRFSPDGTRIVFEHTPDSHMDSRLFRSDISVLAIESGQITLLIDEPGSQRAPRWSPDGEWILFTTPQDDIDSTFYLNRELAIVPSMGGAIRVLTGEFDEHPIDATWTGSGIYFLGLQKTKRLLHHLDHESGKISPVDNSLELISAVDFARHGRFAAIAATSSSTLTEIFRMNRDSEVTRITTMTQQVKNWSLGGAEVIEWKSLDGAVIEGVLYKPDDYAPGDRRPLMVIIHGGPTGTSMPRLVSGYVYPVAQWLGKGAIVLMPNYRGSGGYGEAFRSLNVRNLGVGDMWDVMSGVEHLVEQGIADPQRMGVMGWSQGGYISAFLATNTNRFQAISVGAGISNWMTYYVNTDIHPFTRQYLKAMPWDDPNIYANTSPMTNIKNASTPTLIQHGENDRRVPIPNAYELFQGLRDNNVETKLIVYKGFGHGITKPKELLAATWHNWQWFSKHVWGEDVVIPVETDAQEESGEEDKSENKQAR